MQTAVGEGPIRIAIAGEYPIFEHGLRRLLEAEPGFTIVSDEDTVDVLLVGLASPSGSVHATHTILLSDRIDTPEVAAALAAGVRGVVLKDSTPDMLFGGIRAVMGGHIWLGHEYAARASAGLKKLTAARRQSLAFGLTPREVEIIRAVVDGRSNREIAQRTSISENTVKSHLTHIFNKCGASSRVELALFAAHHRLLDGV